jgi:SAM-dependent methyltransferase
MHAHAQQAAEKIIGEREGASSLPENSLLVAPVGIPHGTGDLSAKPDFKLPANYVSRPAPVYFDDAPYVDSRIVHQPEVYQAADYFLQVTGRGTIIDIGCGNGRKLRSVRARRHIGIDFGQNLSFCRGHYGSWGEWIEADFSREDCLRIAELADEQSVVVCADVVEHLLNPEPLVALLAACYRRGAIVLTSTPDRILVRGANHRGPPPNPSHIREWALQEYVEFLGARGLPAIYAGYTLNNNVERELKTIVTLHDAAVTTACVNEVRARPTVNVDSALGGRDGAADRIRPVAIIAAYNEADVINEVVEDFLNEGCDLVVIDNWSTDQTWTVLSALATRHPARVAIARFPESAPAHCEWRQVLQLKATIAHSFPGRWIIHSDADELRCSPFPGLTLAEGLSVAKSVGANRVDFNVLNFRPIDARPFQPGSLQTSFSYFEYGTRLDGHFTQAKAWLQGDEVVDLVSTGGHAAVFPGAVNFRYKFILQHYPIRSAEHGRRKVLTERNGRWSPQERAHGLHVQYGNFSEASSFLWAPEKLHFVSHQFWSEHGLPIMTDIVERRANADY